MSRASIHVGVLFCVVRGLSGCGCEAEPQTAIMVEVDSDISLAELDRVRLQVDSVEAGESLTNRLDVEYRLVARTPGEPGGSVEGTSEVRLPIRIAVLPRGSDDGAIHLRASGLAPGSAEPEVSSSARLTFVPGRTLLLRLVLAQACVGVVCPEGQTCAEIGGAGLCVDEEIDRPECALEDLEAGRVEGCTSDCVVPADCDDGSGCTTDGCHDGLCTHEPACAGDTSVCCDGLCKACCDDADCDDAIDCTDDSCAAGACSHSSACGCEEDLDCGGGVCCGGLCKQCCDAADCDDGDGCTDDACERAACVHTPRQCPGDADPCVTVACVDDECTSQPACGVEEVCCDGACNSQCCGNADCPPAGDCVASHCVAGSCSSVALPDGAECPGGVCVHATGDCVECLEASDCGPQACRNDVICTAEHTCVGLPAPDGTACAVEGGTMCCGGACVECCDAADCGTDDPCMVRQCVEGRCGEPVCRDDGADCGGGMTCAACTCQ